MTGARYRPTRNMTDRSLASRLSRSRSSMYVIMIAFPSWLFSHSRVGIMATRLAECDMSVADRVALRASVAARGSCRPASGLRRTRTGDYAWLRGVGSPSGSAAFTRGQIGFAQEVGSLGPTATAGAAVHQPARGPISGNER